MKIATMLIVLLLASTAVIACSLTIVPPQLSFMSKEETVCKSYFNAWTIDFRGPKPTNLVLTPCTIPIPSKTSDAKTAESLINTLNLSVENLDTMRRFLKTYADKHVTIEKQNEEAFREFEERRKALDEDICNCSKIELQERYGEWTVYTSDKKDTCSFGASCWTPPVPCPGAVDYSAFNTKLTVWDILELPWKLLKLIKFVLTIN